MIKAITARPMMSSCARWALLGAIVCPVAAHAQSATPAAEQSAQSEPDQLQDIVVTAQRREERLQDVPVAITAVSGDQLVKAAVNDVTDLGAVVPGLTVVSANGQALPRIRGVLSTATGPGVENSTATYIDGVYIGSNVASLLSLANIERVEVLKGPQGTLFGRNSTGGLIHVITRKPKVEPGMEFNATYGNYDTVIATGYVTGGSGNVAADLSVYYKHQGEGFGRNITTGNKAYAVDHDFAVRSKIVFEPTTETSFTLAGDYANSNNSLSSSTILEGTKGLATLPPASYPGRYDTNPNRDAFQRGWQYGGSLRWDQGLGDYSLSTLTAYRKMKNEGAFDFDGTQNPILFHFTERPEYQFSQEIQLLSPSQGAFSWVVGAYYFKAKAGFEPLTRLFETAFPPFSAPTRLEITGTIRTESIAGFAQGTLKLGESTNLTAGIRYTDETKSIEGSTRATLLSTGAPVPTAPVTRRPDVKISTPSYRLSIDHHFNQDVMGYASFNRGFKSGGFSAGAPGDAGYNPETLNAYEVGLKATLFDGRMRINAAAFHYIYKDIQIQAVTSAGSVTINGAAARINGLDLDFDVKISSAFHISGGVQAIDDKFTDYPNALISRPGGAGNGPPLTIGSATGNRLPSASRFIGNLSPQYTVDLGDRSSLALTAAYTYNSGWYPSADNVIRQPAFHMVNGSVRYTLPGGNVSLTAWGKNLANERTFAFAVAIPTGAQLVSYSAPRTYGVTLGAKF